MLPCTDSSPAGASPWWLRALVLCVCTGAADCLLTFPRQLSCSGSLPELPPQLSAWSPASTSRTSHALAAVPADHCGDSLWHDTGPCAAASGPAPPRGFVAFSTTAPSVTPLYSSLPPPAYGLPHPRSRHPHLSPSSPPPQLFRYPVHVDASSPVLRLLHVPAAPCLASPMSPASLSTSHSFAAAFSASAPWAFSPSPLDHPDPPPGALPPASSSTCPPRAPALFPVASPACGPGPGTGGSQTPPLVWPARLR